MGGRGGLKGREGEGREGNGGEGKEGKGRGCWTPAAKI